MLATHVDPAKHQPEHADGVAYQIADGLNTQPTHDSITGRPHNWATENTRPYGQLATWTVDNLDRIDERVLSRPSDCIRKLSINSKFMLWAHQWHLYVHGAHVATCRMVLIQGNKNEIINTWVFPKDPRSCPVFAAELIATAGAPRLTFIDIQTPVMEAKIEAIRIKTFALRQSYANILCDETPPSWAISDSQGGYVFSRQLSDIAFSEIQSCYKNYLTTNLKCFLADTGSARTTSSAALLLAQKELHDYQHHHMDNSPGNTFLSKLFGADWTNDFLRTFLFTVA